MIFVTAIVALGGFMALSTQSNTMARSTTMTMVAAQQKMEQLRGLTWGFDILNLPVSDTTTDISVQPTTQTGSGLAPSPPNSLTQSFDGYVDYLDKYGNWIGTGVVPPRGMVYIRRWSIEPLPANPNNTLILQVLVTKRANRGAADAGAVGRLPEEARLVSVKTRKSL